MTIVSHKWANIHNVMLSPLKFQPCLKPIFHYCGEAGWIPSLAPLGGFSAVSTPPSGNSFSKTIASFSHTHHLQGSQYGIRELQ